MTQVKFYDHDNQITHGGILLDDGDLLCACCGDTIPEDEIYIGLCEKTSLSDTLKKRYGQNKKENCTSYILHIYDSWVDFSKEIID